MAQTCSYKHKKFSLKTEQYIHKKFGLHMNKRKYEDSDDKENIAPITAQTILQAAKEQHQQQPPAKRRQTQPLFRPWLDNGNKTKKNFVNPQVLPTIPSNITTYRPHTMMSQSYNRNSMAYLINYPNQQAKHLHLQQQYAVYQQQVAMMQESIQSALYLKYLQQLAFQRQQQLFVFGNQ